MTSVFLIAEAGSSWRFGPTIGTSLDHCCNVAHSYDDSGTPCPTVQIDNAYRMIRAAKECGADAVKFQWCSDAKALALRRNEPQYAEAYKYVEYPREWLALFKAEADRVGIEFMCTAFLPQDVAVIAPLVKRFKVAAKEATDEELRDEILKHYVKHTSKPNRVFVSLSESTNRRTLWPSLSGVTFLRCVSKYPCPLDELGLRQHALVLSGLSDHTGHVLTGAVAVGAGARVIEVHCKLTDTPKDNPDWPHSHSVDWDSSVYNERPQFGTLGQYIANVRLAERMCG